MSARCRVFPAAALGLTLTLGLGACAPSDRPRDAKVAPGHEIVAGAAPARAAVDASLFELTFPLTDQNGHVSRLAELRGHPFVASMIYTSCSSVCPRTTADLQKLEQALSGRDRERVRFVLFSLDPARDNPEALRRFAREHGLDSNRWTLFVTSPDDMRTLAAVLNVRFRPDADGEIAHSAMIAVVDRDGVVRHRQTGLERDPAPLVAAVRAVR